MRLSRIALSTLMANCRFVAFSCAVTVPLRTSTAATAQHGSPGWRVVGVRCTPGPLASVRVASAAGGVEPPVVGAVRCGGGEIAGVPGVADAVEPMVGAIADDGFAGCVGRGAGTEPSVGGGRCGCAGGGGDATLGGACAIDGCARGRGGGDTTVRGGWGAGAAARGGGTPPTIE